MTPRRAFWDAFATVCIPSAVIWTVIAYRFRGKIGLEGLPIYLFLAAVPLPLIYLLYQRNLKGKVSYAPSESSRDRRAWALGYFVLAFMYALIAFNTPRGGWHFVSEVATAIVWLALGMINLKRARRETPSSRSE